MNSRDSRDVDRIRADRAWNVSQFEFSEVFNSQKKEIPMTNARISGMTGMSTDQKPPQPSSVWLKEVTRDIAQYVVATSPAIANPTSIAFRNLMPLVNSINVP